MNETFKGVIRFLEQNNMQQTLRQLKEEMCKKEFTAQLCFVVSLTARPLSNLSW